MTVAHYYVTKLYYIEKDNCLENWVIYELVYLGFCMYTLM